MCVAGGGGGGTESHYLSLLPDMRAGAGPFESVQSRLGSRAPRDRKVAGSDPEERQENLKYPSVLILIKDYKYRHL